MRLSWTPPYPLGYTTGYRLYYRGGSNGSVDIIGGSADNYLLTGLQNGVDYTIYIVAISQHIPAASDTVVYNFTLGEWLDTHSYHDSE